MERQGLVLIHGAGLGAWAWDRVVPCLEFPALAVDLPLRGDMNGGFSRLGLEDYAQSVIDAIAAFPADKIVLIGHSVGGEIALRVASRLQGRVVGLVLVSAIAPPPGKSMLSLQPWLKRLFMKAVFKFGPPKPQDKVIRAAVCNDLDEATCRLVLEKYSHESPRLFLDPVAWTPAELPPCLYVKTLQDLSVLPPVQDLMIARAKPQRVETLESGHMPMLSKPKELAAILNGFVRSLPS